MRTLNRVLLAATATCALMIAGGAQAAAPTITKLTNVSFTDPGVPGDQVMVVDFDSANAPGFSFTGGYTRLGSLGLDSGVSAPPPGDASMYETVLGGGSATFTSVNNLKSFSFYMGSPDSYNTVEFSGAGFSWTLSGSQIWDGGIAGDGNQSHGMRVRYDFNGNNVDTIKFSSSGNSFEFDSLAAGAVPEPASWAFMIMGFGGMGAVLRRRRTSAAVATA